MKSDILNKLLAMLALATLTACGGGGGADAPTGASGGAGAAPEVIAPPVTPPNSALVTSVPASNYSASGEELAAFTRLNQERAQCGFGMLAQNVQLDAAAKSHNDYQIINNLDSHFQNQQQYPVGFISVNAAGRAAAAGYTNAGSVADEYVYFNSNNKVGYGERGMRTLLNAPYHLSGLMAGFRDVGMSVRSSPDTTPQGTNAATFLHVNASFKSAAGKQLIAADQISTYPCDGSVGINRQLKNEEPNPVPGRDLNLNPIGSTVYLSVREGQVLIISAASIVETSTNITVVLRTPVTAANDPNNIYKSHEGYIVPDAPLKPLTQYAVSVTGSNGGAGFSKTFKFTTGA